jgi:hypothetical protein
LAIYLYCLVRATADPPTGLLGIDGLPVRPVDVGGLRAWISETSQTQVAATVDRARSHDRVVRAAMEIETPLPARFGQVVADHAVLEHVLASRRDAFDAALESVAGAVEMTIQVRMQTESQPRKTFPEPGSAEGGRGRRYLEHVAAEHRREQNVLAEERIVRERVRQAVGPLVRGEAFAGTSAGSNVASLSHLVPRERVSAYRSAIHALRLDDPALSLRVTGPWAPYSFTQVGTHE